MPISPQTALALEYMDNYTGNNLRKRNDLGEILETASTQDSADEFNALVFKGKVVWNLYSTLRKTPHNNEGYAHLEQEFSTSVHELREQLVFFAAHSANDTATRFQEVYLGTGQGTMRNIVDLAHDLARFKDMQNDAKR